MDNKNSINMKFISEQMGVNVSTVSRALNNDPAISQELRTKIIEFSYSHGYTKRKSKADHLLYIIDKNYFSSTSQFFNRIIEGIEEESRKHNFIFNFNALSSDKYTTDNLNINFNKVAGVIITGSYHDNFIIEIKKMNIPVVLVDYYLPTENINSILIDNIDGIITGIKYLSSLGHRKIGYLTGDYKNDIGSNDRFLGYFRALEMFGLEKDEGLIINCDFSITSAYESMKNFLKNNDPYPTALMAVNDMVAIGAMEAIKEFGLKIPYDISILGFDDIALSNEVIPKLSTMHVKKKTMGRLAVKRLVKILKNEDQVFTKTILSPELLIRESTSVPFIK